MTVSACGGTPVKLASGKSGAPPGIAIDAESVYWTADKKVMKVPLGGGPPTTLASKQGVFTSIAVDDANVYSTTSGTELVAMVALSGGSVVTLASHRVFPSGIT